MELTKGSNLVLEKSDVSGKVTWRSPSNIALIKYWGKYSNQLPRNPSLSFTLSEAYTETTISYKPRQLSDHMTLKLLLDGKPAPKFEERTKRYFQQLIPMLPFIDQLDFEIFTRNSFPHSAGIASSASGFSALALGLCTLENLFFKTLADDQMFRKKASYLARLGSGSASRSMYRHLVLWGESGLVKGASNEYAVPIEENVHGDFFTHCDSILIVDQKTKTVSSSAGHQLMEDHPYAPIRYEEAKKHLYQLLGALRKGDQDAFGRICEIEAMQLHALMMSSNPYYMLLKPNTCQIIMLVQEFRKSTGLPLYFTLDAGPNVHLLYPKAIASEVGSFVNSVLIEYCHNGFWIDDRVGTGPIEIE